MQQEIEGFITSKHIAVVGVSRNKNKFGSATYRDIKKRGFQVYPVNPSMDNFHCGRCHQSLADLPEHVDAALITVRPDKAVPVVESAAASPVRKLWFQQGGDFTEAGDIARQAGLEVVTGKCILMYAQPVSRIHAFHRWLWKLIGKY